MRSRKARKDNLQANLSPADAELLVALCECTVGGPETTRRAVRLAKYLRGLMYARRRELRRVA